MDCVWNYLPKVRVLRVFTENDSFVTVDHCHNTREGKWQRSSITPTTAAIVTSRHRHPHYL
jgi:hypothetical protein